MATRRRLINKENNGATLFALLFLAAIIVGAPLVFILVAAWDVGLGFNRTTFVLVCAAIALVGAFIVWVKAGVGRVPSERGPGACDMTQGSVWSRLACQYKHAWPYEYIGLGVTLLGIVLGILYVEYIAPLFR